MLLAAGRLLDDAPLTEPDENVQGLFGRAHEAASADAAFDVACIRAMDYDGAMMKTRWGVRPADVLMLSILAYQIVMLAVWLELDMRPPRWDESSQLLLAQHSFEQLRHFKIIRALKVTDLTLTKSGFVPFLSAITFFFVGTGERMATFLLVSASYVLLALGMRTLALRLFEDVLVGAASFALVTCSGMVILFSHFYTVDLPLMALVTFTVGAAVEVRAGGFRLSGWTFALAGSLLVGIAAKHLFAPFVAAPLLVVVVDGLMHGDGAPAERFGRIVRQGLVVAPAILLGIGYHILNWAIVAEQLKRATTPGIFADLGTAPSHWLMWSQLEQDLLKGIVPIGIVVLPAVGILLLRARFALVLLVSWCVGVWVVLLCTAAWPLIYYYMPLYPAAWLLLVGWLGRGRVKVLSRPLSSVSLIMFTGAGVVAATHADLGTSNPASVLIEAPAILTGPRPQRNPFVAFDSTAPAQLDGNAAVLPYAHDWKTDDLLRIVARKVAEFDQSRSFHLGLLADSEYMSGDLMDFKLQQFKLYPRVSRKYILSGELPTDIDFLVAKTGDIYKQMTFSLKESQNRAELILSNKGEYLRNRHFVLLYKSKLPDKSELTLWANEKRLSVVRDLVTLFAHQRRSTALATVSRFTIDGDGRDVLYTHPTSPGSSPTTVRFDDLPIPPDANLSFGVAINPAVWAQKGDGVDLSLEIEVNKTRKVLFRRIVDPQERPEDRRWIHVELPLDRFAGAKAALVVTVLPRLTTYFDQAGWSCLCIVRRTDGLATTADK